MGIFTKIKNLFTGKGFREEPVVLKEDNTYNELKKAENLAPIKETPIIEEKPIVEKKVSKKETTTTKPKGKEFKKAIKKFDNAGKIKDIEAKLNKDSLNTVSFNPTNDLNSLNSIYKNLFKNSVISIKDKEGNVDEDLIEVLITNRGKLKHRFSAEITINTNNGVGSMDIDGILAEQINDIYNFIVLGGTYTSQELKVAMNNAKNYFERQYGSIGGEIRAPMEKKSTIQSIDIKISFA